ncbi:related to E3 ubiquitin ligase [Cephalotrichum gorgonifer]|uniref:RING-type E3 ubiquitin transferase n=1 Tax=Cephalotrichum gorgonifer TaxID=2041049 RepID=A0AAE8MNB7_9PEZI|nr:related to E3 ubiquitin ligase [Cephalotrichum gorgonifer]
MASTAGGAPSTAQAPGQPRTDSRARGGGRGRGRGKGRGRGRGGGGQSQEGGRGRGQGGPESTSAKTKTPTTPAENADQDTHSVAGTDPDVEICFICANPVVHYAIAPCNHKTCHICGLRMRALYKTKDCAHCRTSAPYVIFADDPEKRFEDYTSADITSVDDNIGVRYANEDIVGDTVLLLRYNCPESSCDFAGLGWPDLHRHVKSAHHKRMCDLCTRNKRVFTHEHELFQDKELEKHMRHGDDRPGAVDQTGFKGHPLCGFCGERFYDSDKLYDHCRHKHERCFICDRQNSREPHYFLNYEALEKHFRMDHFLCIDRECLEKKFVVFGSEMDLKAHQLAEHGDSLSKDVRRDARIVDLAGFDYRQSYQAERGGGGGRRGDRDGRGRGRGRDPNAEPIPPSSAQPMRRDEIAFQRQMAIQSAQTVSNRNFGSQLSAGPGLPGPTPAGAARQAASSRQPAAASSSSSAQPAPASVFESPATSANVDLASLSPQDRARHARHRGVIERAQTFLGNDPARMAKFREDVSSFKNGRLNGPKFLDAMFMLFAETSSNSLGVLIRELAELFEDPAKADSLRKAWQDWRAINEDYPSLPGLGGMHGATTSNTGWAAAASASPAAPTAAGASQKHSTRVLKLKSATRQSLSGPSSSSPAAPSAAVSSWTAPSASTSSRPPPARSAFPSLPTRTATGASRPAAAPRSSWVASAGGSGPARPPVAGADAFPALPAAPKPVTSIFGYGRGSVRRDWGQSTNTGFSWTGGADQGEQAEEEEEEVGKKKKGKGKKVLVQWG